MKAQFSTVPRQIDKFLTANKGNVPTHWHIDSAGYLYPHLRNTIRIAKHFEIPDRDLFGLGEDLTKEEIENTANASIRLPYPAITISRKVDGESMFIVAWDGLLINAIAQKANASSSALESTIYVHGFILSTKGEWIPDVVTLVIDGDNVIETKIVDGKEQVGGSYKFAWKEKNCVVDNQGNIENFTEFLLRDVVELCAYLNRKSTTIETHRESSLKAKLGSKKKKEHKVFYEIHRVVVNAEPKVVTVSEPKGGTHASPRWHERRGYWRTMKKSGKRVWVRACEVGSKSNGMVYKDYQVTTGGG